MKYDIIIIGAGPGGIFSAYELVKQNNIRRHKTDKERSGGIISPEKVDNKT